MGHPLVCIKERDRYWKLNTYWIYNKPALWELLRDRGFTHYRVSQPKTLLASYLQRDDRGLLYYQNCTDEELQSFLKSKGLRQAIGPLESWNWTTRFNVRKRLEMADEDRTFRFLDLSTELREMVIEFYVAGFPQVLKTPAQPPLARTSRLMRREVLPVFYSNITFEIHMDENVSPKLTFYRQHLTELFLKSLAPWDLIRIRNWMIVINRDISEPGRNFLTQERDLTLNIWLHKKGTGFEFETKGKRPDLGMWRSLKQRRNLNLLLVTWLKDLRFKKENTGLKLTDFDVLRIIFSHIGDAT